jgi:hypothetical protein
VREGGHWRLELVNLAGGAQVGNEFCTVVRQDPTPGSRITSAARSASAAQDE